MSEGPVGRPVIISSRGNVRSTIAGAYLFGCFLTRALSHEYLVFRDTFANCRSVPKKGDPSRGQESVNSGEGVPVV